MSFLSFLKRVFDKSIRVPDNKLNSFIYSYSSRGGYLKMASSFVVPNGFYGVIVSKGTVCDVFNPGKYKLLVPNIPIASRLNNLSKRLLNGTFKGRFRGRLYFVSYISREENFEGKKKITLFEKDIKKCKGKINFRLKFRVNDAGQFIKKALSYASVIGDETGMEYVGKTVEVASARWLTRQQITPVDFLDKDIAQLSDLKFQIVKNCRNIGIEIDDFELINTVIGEKLLQKIAVKYPFINDKYIDIPNETDLEKLIRLINIDASIKKINVGNNKKYLSDKVKNHIEENNFKNYKPINDSVINIDDNFNPVTATFKKCPNCNKLLVINTKQCYNCGYKFNEYL